LTSYYSNRIYDSVGIDDDNTRFGLNGGRSILDLIVTVSFAMLIDRVGRRPLFLTATAGMLVFFMCMTILGWKYSQDPSQGIGIGFVVFQWMHGVSYALAWSGLLVAYAVEVLPYKLRAKGLMIMNMSVQAALALNGQVNPIPMDGAWKGSEWKLYTVYTCWIALELVVIYFLYVETRYVPSSYFPKQSLTHPTVAQPSKRLSRSSMARTPSSAASRLTSTARSRPTASTLATATRRRTPTLLRPNVCKCVTLHLSLYCLASSV
jgi:MFS family permease